jgi:hypothetical protein
VGVHPLKFMCKWTIRGYPQSNRKSHDLLLVHIFQIKLVFFTLEILSGMMKKSIGIFKSYFFQAKLIKSTKIFFTASLFFNTMAFKIHERKLEHFGDSTEGPLPTASSLSFS